MELTQAVKTCLFEKFATFQGRATRSEFWWFNLFLVILNFASGAILAILYFSLVAVFLAIGLPGVGFILGVILAILCAIVALLLIIPEFAVIVRRLHDRDMSGWWLLLIFIPTIGIIALLIICALPGTKGPNRFGEDVLENEYNTYRDFKYEGEQDHNKHSKDDKNTDAKLATSNKPKLDNTTDNNSLKPN